MTREEYITMIKTNNFSIELFYEYYTKHNKKDEFSVPINVFDNLFRQYIHLVGGGNIVGTIRSYYDVKFNLITVLDKQGNVLIFM